VLFFSPPSITGRVSDIQTERVVVILKQEVEGNSLTGSSVIGNSNIEDLQQEVLGDVNSPDPLESIMGVGQTGDVQSERTLETLPAMIVEATAEGIEKLKEHPLVEAVYSDIQFGLYLSDSAPLINSTAVNAILVNSTALTGQGIAACVIDTGIQASHPAFGGRVVAQKCYCSSNCCPNGLAEDTVATDTHFLSHGTHVSGIIGANDTYVGVAPGINIVAVKVCSSTCALSDIIAGIDFCVTHKDDYNIKVISGSIGDGGNYISQPDCPTYFDSGIDAAYSAGIVSVFASGNNGYSSGISYPGCSPNAIAVGATDKSDNLASFSNRGALLEVLAPGVSITSAKSPNTYGSLTGTSQATPHVSGAVALLQQYAELTGQIFTSNDIKNAFMLTGKNVSGYPRINILAAIEYLGYVPSNSTPVELLNISIISPTENSIFNGEVLLSANVTGNSSSAAVIWTSNESGSLGSGESITINMTPGAHSLTAAAVSGNQTASANVNITVIAPPITDWPLNISIASPADNSTVYSNGTTFTATVAGNNSDNFTVAWTSNVSGILGDGASINAVLLFGSHTIAATVTESNESATTSIIVNVVYSPITIEISIASPTTNSILLANGTNLIATSSPAGTINWSSNVSGILGTGSGINVNLSAGLHKITAVSTVNGSTGNASVNVKVISSPCIADIDLNNNTNADIGDMILLLTAFNTNAISCITPSTAGECVVDLDQNKNNVYNSNDIIDLMRNIILGSVYDIFGASC
jgi:hypothetical protein